jgi:branched-chain amino acid aminotransferase
MQVDDLSLRELWGWVYVNGRLVDAGSAQVSAFDRGFLYGDGIYETLRVYSGRPFMLEEHWQRMAKGCEVIGLAPPSMAEVEKAAYMVLEANNLSQAYLRITAARGATGRLWHDLASDNPTLMAMAKPLTPPDFGPGLRLVVSRFRADEHSPLSSVKQLGILPKILARAEAGRSGADDALFLNTAGRIAEATASNIFWAAAGKLFTPSQACGLLPGVTRSVVISIAAENGIPVAEGEFGLDDLMRADEVFLTSSTWEVAPVRSLNGSDFPLGSPGPLTTSISKLYKERVAGITNSYSEE